MRRIALPCLLLCLGPISALAHHSSTRYDPENSVTLEGTVVGVDLVNPHVYLRLEADGATGDSVVWQIEGPGVNHLLRNGQNTDSLAAGERVSVDVYMNRDPSKVEVRGFGITKEDGTTLWLYGGPEGGFERPEFSAPGFSGVWEPKRSLARYFSYDNEELGPTSWPLTPAGRSALERHDPLDQLDMACLAGGPPIDLVWSNVRGLSVSDEAVSVYISEPGYFERVVHMDRDSFDGLPSVVGGQSIGRWEDDVLVVETARYLYHPMGNAEHLASSSEKRLTERFELLPNGEGLTYSFVLYDPVYLAEPVELSMEWTYRPDLSIDDFAPCDEDAARRGLE